VSSGTSKAEMRNGIPTYDRDGPDIAEASGSDAKRFSKGKMLDAILVNNTSANMLPYYNSSNRIHNLQPNTHRGKCAK
jgi:hypothetical protein